jgi:predicted transglutaminase-like cysteine proteinase
MKSRFSAAARVARRAQGRTFRMTVTPALMALSACSAQGARPSSIAAPPPAEHRATGAAMQDGGAALSPQGWLDFCARNPADPSCRAAFLTPARAAQLRQVEDAIRKIPRRTDQRLYGVPEYWRVANRWTGGDCEDLALAARQRLIAMGWPLSSLRLATAWTEDRQYHLVLSIDVIVDTAVETLVIDSRYPRMRTYRELLDIGYRFHSRQAATGGGWVRIEPAPAASVEVAAMQAPSPATAAAGPAGRVDRALSAGSAAAVTPAAAEISELRLRPTRDQSAGDAPFGQSLTQTGLVANFQ